MKLKHLLSLALLTVISVSSYSQNDSLFVTHDYTETQIDPYDSTVVFGKLALTFHNVDTLNYTKCHAEVVRVDDDQVISRQNRDISLNTPEMTINNDNVTIVLGFYPIDLNYTIYSRLITYQGVETDIFTNNVSDDD